LQFAQIPHNGQIERAAVEIQALQGQIPGLLEVYVGRNESPRSQGYALAA